MKDLKHQRLQQPKGDNRGGEFVDDKRIIELYFKRDEAALKETSDKYGRLCLYIAKNILENELDAEECVNDAYLRAWQSIPPTNPRSLGAYISKITRNLALDRYDSKKAQKRASGGDVPFDELEAVISDKSGTVDDEVMMRECINSFLYSLDKKKRIVFVQRYFYMCTLEEIAKNNGIKMINLKVMLYRLREKLKKHLALYGFDSVEKKENEEVENEKE